MSVKRGKINLVSKCIFASVFASFVFGVANAAAYTITFNSTFGEFDGGATTNVVEYNDNHEVINGEYKEPVYNNGTDSSNFITWYSEYDAKNRVNIDEVSEDMTVYAAYEKIVWRFDYTGGEQTLSLPIKAGLQLKVWGAQGRTLIGPFTVGSTVVDKIEGGYGGYSTGLYDLNSNDTLYIYVGGTGSLVPINSPYTLAKGGYNGGGDCYTTNRTSSSAGGGGGLTHIATQNGLLSSLEDNKDSVIIVAGGGGGKVYSSQNFSSPENQAHGGGYMGNGYGAGTQTSGYAFGQGYNSVIDTSTIANVYVGSGGGYYGGISYSNSNNYATSGGSGFIGNTIENTRYMVGYDVPISDTDSIKTISTNNVSEDPIEDYAKKGNGYAQAELTRLNIRYINEFDGTDFTKDQYVGSLAQDLSITQRPGYTAAWYKGNDVWDFNDPVNFDLTLTAKYTPIVYNLAYNLGISTLSGANPDTYTIETDDITLNNPTAPDYYSFYGWSGTDLTGDRNLTVTILKGSIGNREYTANIAPTPYTIIYNLDGGTNGTNNPSTYNYESGEITLARPTKEGYTFIGWTGTDLSSETLDVVIPANSHGNREYTATWSINEYTATFDANTGSAATPASITKEYNTELGTLPTTTKNGYRFLGWFTDSTNGIEITSTTRMPANNNTYYAHWEIITYTIEYDMGDGVNDPSNPTSYTVEDVDITLAAPTHPKPWYYFVGWASDRDTEDGLSANFTIDTTGAKNIKVYAIFQANPYTVSFDSDGAGDFNSIVRQDDEPVGELPVPTKEGYTFLGWFVNGAKVDPTSIFRTDVTAVAMWEEIIIVPNTGMNTMLENGGAIVSYLASIVACFVISLFAKSILKNRK